MRYRAEIDGLRAVAVIPVILFHAGFNFFSGGFVGVDVFFVISGYLITSVILSQLENDNFSIFRFYERRARRILPALYFVMFVSLVWSLFYQAPFSGRDFFQSVAATTLFAQNFLLFFESSDYFDLGSEFKPLLHTWSLAVEEQFYVVFPILLILIWKFYKSINIRIFFVLLLASIFLEIGASSAASFYLPYFRAWELLAGAICASVIGKFEARENNVAATLGIVLIVIATFSIFLTPDEPFPLQLSAVVGTILIILFARGETFVARALSLRPIVGIGLISYSAYLWHQPILAFSRLRYGVELSSLTLALIIASTLVLAFFSWKFVETPFRKDNVISRGVLYWAVPLSTACLLAIGVLGHYTIGFEKFKLGSYPPQRAELYVSHAKEVKRRTELYESLGDSYNLSLGPEKSEKPQVLLIGDSMSQDLLMSFSSQKPLGYRVGLLLLDGNCFSDLLAKDSACGMRREDVDKSVTEADLVILASDWVKEDSARAAGYFYEYIQGRQDNVKVLGALRFRHFSDTSYDFITSGLAEIELPKFVYQRLDHRTFEANELLKSKVRETDYIDKFSFFCTEGKSECRSFSKDGTPYFYDELHLTIEGLSLFGKFLEERLPTHALE